MKSPHTGIKRILAAFGYSCAGIKSAFKSEAAFRQDILLCGAACVALAFLPLDMFRKILMFFALCFIPIAELINTAIENLVDRIGPEYHELSKSAKDIGSAIVMLTIAGVGLFWGAMIYFAN